MKGDLERKLEGIATKVLKKVGIKDGQVVLDFGCGSGDYTIPAAKIVGNKGKIYALDKDESVLKEVTHKARSQNLKNIRIIKTSGNLRIPIDDDCADVILLYDVLHSHYFEPPRRQKQMTEVYRIAKSNGLISIFPKHIEPDDLKELMAEMKKTNFFFENRIFTKLVHSHELDEGYLLNFRKGCHGKKG